MIAFLIPLLVWLQASSLPALSEARPVDGTHVYDLSVRPSPDSAWHAIGTMTVELTTLHRDGRALMRRVATSHVGARVVVDTTLSLESSLAPISERTHKPTGIISYDFARDSVTGFMSVNGAEHAIHVALPGPTFNSTDLELIIRSLPLAPGYQVRLPIYDPELGGYRFTNVRVQSPAQGDSTDATSRNVWVVLDTDASLQITYRVARATRELLSMTIVNPQRKIEAQFVLRHA